jgi:hypothetical protein
MIKKCIIAMMTLALIVPLYSQEKKASEEKKVPVEKKAAEEKTTSETKNTGGEKQKITIWQDAMLDDFETTPYTDKNITYNKTNDQDAGVSVRDQLPATANSKKYLGVKVKSRGNDIFIIKPGKDWVIDKHCRSISLWVYGKKTMTIISILLQDTKQQNHLIQLGTIDFLGWKKMTVNLNNRIAQSDDFLNQKKTMKVLQLQFRTTGSLQPPSHWQYFYLDDFTASVRERYDDRQSDEW